MAGAPWPVQPVAPTATGWPSPYPTAPGGGAWGPPPWGWSPYQEGTSAPQPPPASATGGPRRKQAPWVVAISAIALLLAGLGVGVAVGYGVWNTSQAPAASFRPGAFFPNGPSTGGGGSIRGGFPPATQSKRAFLGVEVESGSGSGAHVVYVLGTSPAAKAGIADGDTITKFGTATVTSPTSLRSAIDNDKPGQKVKVAWTTSTGKKQTATVTLSNPSSSQG
jgi:membrane-associated protease RseP (regulator of RpoE activity)